jgi:glucose/arabinose dehydrogenase
MQPRSFLPVLLVSAGAAITTADPGDTFLFSADRLPAPGTTLPRDIDPQFVELPARFLPKVPAGFSVSVFASGAKLGHVRWLTTAPNGDVFLAETGVGKITLLRDADGDGKAELIATYAQGFTQPHGIRVHNNSLYVADVRAIWRLPYRDGDTAANGKPLRVTTAPNLRTEGWHLFREIAFDPKGSLYLTIAARMDAEDNDPPPDATVQLVNADGTMAPFATGLRNVTGLAVQPGTGDLWGTVNERDTLGAQLPPDFLARLGKGDFFGWPYAYTGPHPDPTFGAKRPDLVAMTKTPEVLFEAHAAPLGVVFYDGSQFPPEYQGDAFVAFHGSGPYDKPTGYKVVRVRFKGGKPVGGYEDFLTGFFDTGKPNSKGILSPRVWGTPTGLAVAKDGSLLVADEKAKTVWRVSYRQK